MSDCENFTSKTLLALLIILLFSSCASTYSARASLAIGAYNRGDYTSALELMDKVKFSQKDKLLYLFDKGMILHAAGRYEESNKILAEAEEISNQNAVKSASREVSAALWSEEATEYAGDKHERVTIPTIRLLNYVMLDDWDGALVEARHLRIVAEKVYGNSKELTNAFSLYLSAVIWETIGQINDAFIDYKQIAKSGMPVPYVAADVRALAAKLGLEAGMQKSGINSVVSAGYRKRPGQLIVIMETGSSPRYMANYVATGYFSVSVPMLVGGGAGADFADVKIDGRSAGRTYPFYNISEDIFDALKDRQRRSFIRKMVKLGVQGGLYGAGGELAKSDEAGEKAAGILMILLGFSMSAAEKADTRNWLALPADFQIGRFYLEPGTHEIEIVPSGIDAEPIKKTVEITKTRPSVLLAHYPESGEFSKMTADSVRARRIKTAGERQARLEDDLKTRPKDGRVKLDLAIARMELGDYAVAGLLDDAIKEGADRKKTAQMQVIAKTVSGDIAGARKDAKAAAALKLGGQFEDYEEKLSYLAGEGTFPEDALSRVKGECRGFADGFDHYLAGLADEKAGVFDRAAVEFAKAHDCNLSGEIVAKKMIENYQKTGNDFRKSDEGIEVATSVAEVYCERSEQ